MNPGFRGEESPGRAECIADTMCSTQLKGGSHVRQLIIIGSGPAGFTAAIYAARANLAPLVIASSVEIGGDLMQTTEVENFPGFPEAVMGPDLMAKMQQQAERFGAEIVYDDAAELELDGPIKRVHLGNGGVEEAQSLIFATGSAYRKLGVPGEDTLFRSRCLVVRHLRRLLLP